MPKQLQRKLLRKQKEFTPEDGRALARLFFAFEGGSYRAVIGVDEVGRGPLFGPVSVGAVLITPESWQAVQAEPWFLTVTDSKLLSEKKRAELSPLIAAALPYAVSHVAVRYIDMYNINRAIQKGIYRSVQRLLRSVDIPPAEIRIIADGNSRFPFPAVGMAKPMPRINSEIKADLKYFPVSAASIVAKVSRDRMITNAHTRFPEYNLAGNAGYGTLEHREAIMRHGQTRFHRKSFKLRSP